jgi:hypothetical protein
MSRRLFAGVIRRMLHSAEGAMKPLFRPTRLDDGGFKVCRLGNVGRSVLNEACPT